MPPPITAVAPLTEDTWEDLEALFGPQGALAGCWCMWNLQTQREFNRLKGDPNRELLHERVRRGPPPGLLAYSGDEPVGWVSLGPRSSFGRIQRSPVTRAVDDEPVWSVVCFFIAAAHRRRGVGASLLAVAEDHARSEGAAILEAYPVVPRRDGVSNLYAWMGPASMFFDAGYEEVARRSPTRPVVRKALI